MHRRRFLRLLGFSAAVAGVPILRPVPVAARAPRHRKVLCLGLDGMDPQLLERFLADGILPHLARLRDRGDFQPCGTTVPPQSPVAWSTFITGLDPGGHGIFDFIHRDPATMLPALSLAETRPPRDYFRLGDWKVPRHGGVVSLQRHGRAFFEDLAAAGIDTTLFKLPSNYPPVDCGARSLSGMGTPDLLGTYGLFTLITDRDDVADDLGGGRVQRVVLRDGDFATALVGPPNSYREGEPAAAVTLTGCADREHGAAVINVGGRAHLLRVGEWSDWVRLRFEMVPHLKAVSALCRLYLMECGPALRLYVTPLQVDPADPALPICTPADYGRELADAVGPFYTQGLPDDTKALDEGVFDDADAASQADLVLAERFRQYDYELARFRRQDRAFLFFYFNSLDQGSHMFWRNMDAGSPMHASASPVHAGRIRALYRAMDRAVGQALDACGDEGLLLVVSDHGFAPYHRSFHLNTWLHHHGYLELQPGVAPGDAAYLSGIDWRRTTAYGLGINGLYLNRRGREMRGIVGGADAAELIAELAPRLEEVMDPGAGRRVVQHAYRADREFHGPHAAAGPDLVLGYARGYRGSNETALARVGETLVEDNRLCWSGDHCMAADAVPGVLLCNRPLQAQDPHLRDLAPTILGAFGLAPGTGMTGRDLLA